LNEYYIKEIFDMVSKTVKVINPEGLHMRVAGILAKKAASYKYCNITLNANGKSIKAKALMQLMAACIKKDCEVEIVCEGENEQAVLDEIAAMFENGFGEV
jgi:phosphocarrier protein